MTSSDPAAHSSRPFRSPLARRLALSSVAVFASAATILLVLEYAILQHVIAVSVDVTRGRSDLPATIDGATAVFAVAEELLRTVMISSTVIAAVLVALAGIITWHIASRSLGRVAEVTELTRRITTANLNERLGLHGPPDEIGELANTIDDMLSRLGESFERQDRFVANASHELRTPLTVMRASLEATLLHDTVPDPTRVSIGRALDAVSTSSALLTSLLQLARARTVPADRTAEIDFGHLLSVVLELTSEAADAMSIEISVDTSPVVIVGDAVLVVQALFNLVDNAIRHNVAGGTVSIAAFDGGGGGGSRIEVRNSGRVIAPDAATRLREPFDRGRETRQASDTTGFGLGLSIVDTVMQQHGGALLLDALPTGGLRAVLSFPCAADANGGIRDGLTAVKSPSRMPGR
ncbi:sensor histidine kinase [Plantibacter sp. YIM 135347]|uniref:sensor histidine kinase n=1 Tax=Plantibacter sp. YIM 135347 TaxID=3423919 RepID=UPI003D348FA7